MASVLLVSFWLISTLLILLVFIIKKSNSIPNYLNDLFVYGKVKNSKQSKSFVKLIDVPKRWFTWFYLLGIICNGLSAYFVYNTYVMGINPPNWYKFFLDFFQERSLTPKTSALSGFIAIFLMLLQDIRRFLECIFISSYSKSTMNVIHFLLGVILYATFNLAVLSEAPMLEKLDAGEFFRGMNGVRIPFGIIVFVLGSSFQHYSHRLFAGLRKDRAGKIKSTAHVMPSGKIFEYISNPHYLGEIIIYSGFVCILGLNHSAGIAIWLFVFINQIIAALLNHNWYQEKFKNFPKTRKAIIPFAL